MQQTELPPPPPKGSHKTLIAAIVVAVVVVAAVGGAYLIFGGSQPPQTNGVGTASSLQFSVNATHGGASLGIFTFTVKNIGTSNMMMRVEERMPEGSFTDIVNGAQQKAWVYEGGEWADVSGTFSSQWSSWNSTWIAYRDNLLDWTGHGDWTYTAPNGDTMSYYNIAVNPSLPDSLFEPS